MKLRIEDVKFDERGLVPAVVQDAETSEVLTLAYMNAESLQRTLETRETWFWSRSRSQLWHKGETSGHTQHVVDVQLDCDQDALVVKVKPRGPACHTGALSCFQSQAEDVARASDSRYSLSASSDLGQVFTNLYALIQERRVNRPENSYTTYLFNQGLDKILKKIGEESAETIIAAKNSETNQLVAETSDLLYHLIVLLVERGIALEDVCAELLRRGGNHSSR